MAQTIQIKKSVLKQEIMNGATKKDLAAKYGVSVVEMSKTIKACGIERMPVFRSPIVQLVDDEATVATPDTEPETSGNVPFFQESDVEVSH